MIMSCTCCPRSTENMFTTPAQAEHRTVGFVGWSRSHRADPISFRVGRDCEMAAGDGHVSQIGLLVRSRSGGASKEGKAGGNRTPYSTPFFGLFCGPADPLPAKNTRQSTLLTGLAPQDRTTQDQKVDLAHPSRHRGWCRAVRRASEWAL